MPLETPIEFRHHPGGAAVLEMLYFRPYDNAAWEEWIRYQFGRFRYIRVMRIFSCSLGAIAALIEDDRSDFDGHWVVFIGGINSEEKFRNVAQGYGNAAAMRAR